jgi:hypothetical protein
MVLMGDFSLWFMKILSLGRPSNLISLCLFLVFSFSKEKKMKNYKKRSLEAGRGLLISFSCRGASVVCLLVPHGLVINGFSLFGREVANKPRVSHF